MTGLNTAAGLEGRLGAFLETVDPHDPDDQPNAAQMIEGVGLEIGRNEATEALRRLRYWQETIASVEAEGQREHAIIDRAVAAETNEARRRVEFYREVLTRFAQQIPIPDGRTRVTDTLMTGKVTVGKLDPKVEQHPDMDTAGLLDRLQQAYFAALAVKVEASPWMSNKPFAKVADPIVDADRVLEAVERGWIKADAEGQLFDLNGERIDGLRLVQRPNSITIKPAAAE